MTEWQGWVVAVNNGPATNPIPRIWFSATIRASRPQPPGANLKVLAPTKTRGLLNFLRTRRRRAF